MKRLLLSLYKDIFLLLFALLLAGIVKVEGANRYSVATGNWNATATWSATSGGAAGASVPGAGDNVFIQDGFNVTVNINNAVCSNIQVGVSKIGTGTLSFLGPNSQLTVNIGFILGDNSNGVNKKEGYLDMINGGLLKIGGVLTAENLGSWIPGTGTIEFTSLLAQTIYVNTYNNLTLSGSGTKTITGVIVNGILSMEGTATVSGTPTYGASATLQYNTATSRTSGAEWITPFIATGGVKITNTGTITLNAAKVINSTATLIIDNGAKMNLSTFTSSAYKMNLGGEGVISGSWGSSNSTATYKNDTYFEATTGLINITFSTCVTLTAPITTGAFICIGSTATLAASGAMVGGKYLWYSAATGGVPIKTSVNHNDQTYTTSVLATTSDFWVSIQSVGRCESARTKVTATVTPLPVATFGYTGSPYCQNAANPSPTYSGGGVAGTFSSTSGLVFVSAASGQINLAASTPGAYMVTNTIAASGGCNIVTATTTVTIIADGSWTGAINTDWNNPGNWACNQLPTLTSNVLIANGKPNYPTLSGGVTGAVNNLGLENAGSLTITGNTLQIAGSISNNGIFTASEGTIEMKGVVAQVIGSNVFADNTILNLTVNNPAGVTLQGALNVTGIVTALNGNLSSGGNLTLVSTAAQTALIDGIGAGNVLGDVNMQRYLPSAFGYKYVSSPFQAATVNELAQEVDLGATFPSFYKYDQNNSIDSSGVTIYKSGWVNYNLAGNALVPLAGYAANLGANLAAPPITAHMTGIVNYGSLQMSLNNHNRKFTKGFNLVGNPYPSPIDWDATGWTKTNVDNAVYFFNASGDQYSGTYSSYVNGVSTGNGDNVIAAMQGFFVHVSNGAFPVSGTLGVTNSVRVNDLNPVFKRAVIDNRSTLRFTASFEHKNAMEDASVIYFDNAASQDFDQDLDALKMTNTDLLVPNIYSLSPELNQLSINGMPIPSDDISKIPLGITTFTDGWVTLTAEDINRLPAHLYIYLLDAETGLQRDLKQVPDYRFYLKSGQYDGRFSLVLSQSELAEEVGIPGKLFTLFRMGDYLSVKANLPETTRGTLMVTNLLGQIILHREVNANETVEINQKVNIGVFVLTLISGKLKHSEKVIMRKDYE